jgi:FkbM family methyltransferase
MTVDAGALSESDEQAAPSLGNLARILRVFRNPTRLAEVRQCRNATPDWVRLVAAYGGAPFQPFAIRLASGPFEFREKSDVATFWRIFFGRLYELEPSDRIIFDAGGNIGAFSLYALLRHPSARVIAVEPSGSTFSRLESTVHANGVADRCTCIRAALGGTNGITRIVDSGPSQFRFVGNDGEPVRQATLESLLPDGDGPVDYLKMDIEGAEYDALGQTPRHVLRRIRRIGLEYHPSHGTIHRWPALREHLRSADFKVVAEHHDGGGYGMAYLAR